MDNGFENPIDTAGSGLIAQPHALPHTDVLTALAVTPAVGLTDSEASRRRLIYGANELAAHTSSSAFEILLHQLLSPVVGLLFVAAGLSAGFGDWVEALAIVVVLVLNTLIGFVTESKAQTSMAALRVLGVQSQRVRRAGKDVVVPATDLVPGDIVLLEEGDVATADIRLITASDIAADESTLTGESVPVHKLTEPVASDAPLGDRTSMIFKGTAITRGAGVGCVTATGQQTELGHIAALAAGAEPDASPLTKKLAGLSKDLVVAVVAIAAVLAVLGALQGHDWVLMTKTAISLAVAAIPEGLPVVATLVLARGMLKMAAHNAVIERLSAVETLGATTVILTDKTGTLTENRMTVTRLVLQSGELGLGVGETAAGDAVQDDARRLLTIATLCNAAGLDAAAGNGGDPMERAILAAAWRNGLRPRDLQGRYPELRRLAFDSQTKIMATWHRDGDAKGGVLVAVKGAPEAVFARTRSVVTSSGRLPFDAVSRDRWEAHVTALGRRGLRVLAVAEADGVDAEASEPSGLSLLGLLAFEDPPRADVPAALAACRTAGIKVVMVTGDHAVTAASIAKAVGLGGDTLSVVEGRTLDAAGDGASEKALTADVLARVTPRQKLELVAAYQKAGHVVAMTGDGVNDAPALKKADIGIAMGLRGTEVARQAAAMVLRDDAFPTIVTAIREGRVIFGNIRRFVVYLLACNLSEVLVVSLAVLAGLPLPLQPIQILFLNLVTDVFPALALATAAGAKGTLLLPPRSPQEPLVARRHWVRIVLFGTVITVATLSSMLLALNLEGLDRNIATTTSFLTLAFSQLLFAFNMTDAGEPVFDNSVFRNRNVWGAVALCTGLLVAASLIPPLSRVLKVVQPDLLSTAIVIGTSFAAAVAGGIVLHASRIYLARHV